MTAPALEVDVLGLSAWCDDAPSWEAWRHLLRGRAPSPLRPDFPVAQMLSAAERRRVPKAVSLALHVADQAVRAAGLDPRHMPSVFASCHGDLATTDALCDTLARDPSSLSPTRFMQSVHNTASGYWSIAHGCTQPSLAVAAGHQTMTVSLLEAASQVMCGASAVLWVAYEVQAQGALQRLTHSPDNRALACVLRASETARDPRARTTEGLASHRLGFERVDDARSNRAVRDAVVTTPRHDSVSTWLDTDLPPSDAMAWLHALAGDTPSVLAFSDGVNRGWRVHVQPARSQDLTRR